MAADPDIQKAIEIIDRKIQSLLVARNQLAQAFGIADAPQSQPSQQLQMRLVPPNAAPQQLPRKEALAAFLIQNGSMSRSEIVSRSGLPEGTVSYCLNDKRFFEQSEDGVWSVTDFSRKGFEMRNAEVKNERLPA
jgi:hypothetical protein